MRKMTTSPPLRPRSCAVVCAQGLGDGLLSMVLAHNLTLSGIETILFSTPLCGLKRWFPGRAILPFPSPDALYDTLSPFDMVLAADHSLVKEGHCFNNQLIILKEDSFDKHMSLVDNLSHVCKNRLSLPCFFRNNGITPPSVARHRYALNRVIIHPMSTTIKRTWPAEKFLLLYQELEKLGYEPFLCVSPQEAIEWRKLIKKENLRTFEQLSDLALFIYESGYLVGNNSGLGHLASSLHVPTLSLFAKKSYARLWRPHFGPGMVVTPPAILPFGRLRQKYWKALLSVGRVTRAFQQLVGGRTLAHPSPEP